LVRKCPEHSHPELGISSRHLVKVSGREDDDIQNLNGKVTWIMSNNTRKENWKVARFGTLPVFKSKRLGVTTYENSQGIILACYALCRIGVPHVSL